MAVSRAAKPHQDYVWYAVPTTGDLGAATYWYDLTTSAPATKAPGAADSATIYGVYGGTILTGSLTVASLTTGSAYTARACLRQRWSGDRVVRPHVIRRSDPRGGQCHDERSSDGDRRQPRRDQGHADGGRCDFGNRQQHASGWRVDFAIRRRQRRGADSKSGCDIVDRSGVIRWPRRPRRDHG